MYTKAGLVAALLASTVQAGPGIRPRDYLEKKNCDKANRFDLPVQWNSLGFLTNASFGTPAVQVPMLVDWTWMSQLIISPKCFGEFDPQACMFPGQIHLDQRESSTFKNLSGTFDERTWAPNHFFFADPLHVQYGSDILHLGPVSGEVVTQYSDMTFNVSAYGFPFPFGGVFGLSPIFKGDDVDFQSPFYQQWKKGVWKSGLSGFVYCYDDDHKAACDGWDGIQSLGGIRRDLIKNDKIWWYKTEKYVDVNTLNFKYDPAFYNYWGIELDTLKIGDENQKIVPTSNSSGKAAIFDHASYGRGIALTANAYDSLVEMTQGTPIELETPVNNGEEANYAVDCTDISSFPTVSYKFRGHSKEWSVTPEHYIETLADGTCVLNVRVLADGDRFMGNFGETFAKDKYVILDFEKGRVGLADIKW